MAYLNCVCLFTYTVWLVRERVRGYPLAKEAPGGGKSAQSQRGAAKGEVRCTG